VKRLIFSAQADKNIRPTNITNIGLEFFIIIVSMISSLSSFIFILGYFASDFQNVDRETPSPGLLSS
jgi:hypothetical protein